jgi:hypothetical protein
MGTTHEIHITSRQPGPRLVRLAPRGGQDGSTRTKRLNPELVRKLRMLSDQLKGEFTELLDVALAAKAGRLFTRLLLPARQPPGRPGSPVVIAARDLLAQDIPWRQIPWRVIPGFANMTRPEQSFAREGLRRALYMRLKRGTVTNSQRVS